ncbi:vWA domain-containing protein [Marinicella gelatinilytica]|uniref:vWA domain-containing protein n=1 Tax=Marinicella gelatinilytica TaxID=2996017 RepID=UPI002260E1DF|nr:VWA domain-containing protein [Marinicella gelatinilytica]MCX7545240.1 VWA domain-containing protein [Marinicella gelatinilytica]
MIQMLWPWVFMLVPLPFIMAKLPRVSGHQLSTIRYPIFAQLPADQKSASGAQSWLKIISWLMWLALLTALARPQWVGDAVALPVEGRDLMLAIDLSGSMEQQDMQLNGQPVDRLTALKDVAGNFIKRRQGDRLGLILFGEKAYLQAPFTFDILTVNRLLQEAVIGLAGKSTAIGDAVGLAVKKMRTMDSGNRVLILLTDGANTAGVITPLKAAQLAKAEDVKIYTIGFGADEMIVNSFFGGQRRINPSSDLDEATMTRIAELTGGQYFRATNTRELEAIYDRLNELEPLAEEDRFYRPTKALYYWPMGVFMGLMLFSLWLQRRWL